MPMWLVLVLVLAGALMSAVGGIFLKLGALRLEHVEGLAGMWKLLTDWQVVAGLGMYFIPAMLWIYMLRKVELSLLQPLMAIVYVITPILAIIVLKERVPIMRWVGVGVIFVGVILVARS